MLLPWLMLAACDADTDTTRTVARVAAAVHGPLWQLVETAPLLSLNAALAYDGARNQLVMFTDLGETWLFDGSRWSKPTVPGPSPRSGQLMAYDRSRQRVVLFGGFGSNGALPTTWEWDGTFWMRRSTDGPTDGVALLFDGLRDRLVLYGRGPDGGAQIWVWNGTTWVEQALPSDLTAQVSEYRVAYDSARRRLVLFSGIRRYGEASSDTWESDGTSWFHRASGAPASRSFFRLLYDSARGKTILLGGNKGDGGDQSEVWEWDGTSWTQRDTTGAPTSFGAAAFDSTHGVTVMLGSAPSPTGAQVQISQWDGTAWLRRELAPDPGAAVLLTYDSARQRMTLVESDANTWAWEGQRWRKLTLPLQITPPVAGGAIAYDSRRRAIVAVGGAATATEFPGTWEWSSDVWRKRAPTMTPGDTRQAHAIAFDRRRSRVVLFGGWTDLTAGFFREIIRLGDTWEWDGVTWTQRTPPTSPTPRVSHAMAYDRARGKVVLFGGDDGLIDLDDTWEWDGSTWTLRSPPRRPPQRRSAALAYASDQRKVILSGGSHSGQVLRDTWAWDGTTWTELESSGPPRHGSAMAYDEARRRLVMISSANPSMQVAREVWEMVAAPEPADDMIPGGSDDDYLVGRACDNHDACPTDPEKTAPGVCGCGVADTDADADGTPDCVDLCPSSDDSIDRNANGIPDGCDDKVGCTLATPASPSTRVGDVVVHSQVDVDRLAGVQCITGTLEISDTTLTTLSGLRSLRAILGILIIRRNDLLVDLSGLEALVTVGDAIQVSSNLALTSLFAPNPLPSAQYYWLGSNPNLPACEAWEIERTTGMLCGDPDFGRCSGNLGAGSCGTLPPDFECVPGARGPGVYDGTLIVDGWLNFRDLGGLTCVTGAFYAVAEVAPDIAWLANLQMVGERFLIANNRYIENLDPLAKLTHVGTLEVRNNALLGSVSGLANVKVLGNGPDYPAFWIHDNPNLPACNVADLERRTGLTCGDPNPSAYACTGNTGKQPCGPPGACASANGGCDPFTECNDDSGEVSCGSCPDGFTGNGTQGCVDIDECALGTSACDPVASCRNSPGGHACTCPAGMFDLFGNGTQCVAAPQVAAGMQHSCSIARSGALYCWGDNGWGQLGDETAVDRTAPVRVGLANDWQAVTAGGMHSCGIRSGRLYCWGSNGSNQLGIVPSLDARAPTQVGSEEDWQAVAAGYAHTCGIRAGALYCWGSNEYGQLGDVEQGDVRVPRRVRALPGWSSVSAARFHNCGIRRGAMYCWGRNLYYVLGSDTAAGDGVLVRVGTDSDWMLVTSGQTHSCGIRQGSVYCWGGNLNGELGTESTTPAIGPTQVGSGGLWTGISAGESHSCGVRAGQLYCWGLNNVGQLGDGTMTNQLLPTPIGTETDWLSVRSGGAHSCGVRGEDVYCWGFNTEGQLGDGTTTFSTVPVSLGDESIW